MPPSPATQTRPVLQKLSDDRRAAYPVNDRKAKISGKTGAVAFNGTGAATVFAIPHGLKATPKHVQVNGTNAVGRADKTWTADATNITVTFAAAPVSGTANVQLSWLAGS